MATAPKPRLTHFLCIPLVTSASRPHLARSLSVLRADASTPDAAGPALVPPEAVRPPGTLHFTLGVMSFPQDEGLDRAIDLLESLQPREILCDAIAAATTPRTTTTTTTTATTATTTTTTTITTPIPPAADASSFAITLRGLRAMGNPSKTSVLYSPPVDDLGILQRFGEAVRRAFSAADLVVDDGRPLLLHATLVNTVYARASSGPRGRGRGAKLEVDATALMDRYGGHVWLENLPLDRLAICKMGARSVPGAQDDAEYEVEAEVRF